MGPLNVISSSISHKCSPRRNWKVEGDVSGSAQADGAAQRRTAEGSGARTDQGFIGSRIRGNVIEKVTIRPLKAYILVSLFRTS
jgi:hypothetical protein